MAPISKPGSVTVKNANLAITSRSSILELGKSQDAFDKQIQEACSILDIELESLWQGLEINTWMSRQEEQRCNTNAPRYEWTLNWLLKKLREYNHTESACLLPEAWLLLRFLIAHTHPAKVARLLTSNKYTEILRNTLDRFWNAPGDAALRPSSAGTSYDIDSSESDSSQVHIYGVRRRVSKNRTSKKRKRGGAEVSTCEQSSDILERTSILFRSIVGTLFQVQYLQESQVKKIQSIIIEQLKFALRSPPEEAAGVLGSGIYLLNHIAQRAYSKNNASDKGPEAARKWLGLGAIESYANLFVVFWEKQSPLGGNETEQSRYQAFTKESLLPCLLFLHTCRESFSQEDPIRAFTGKLESMIATNVIMPMRKSDLNKALTKAFLSSPFPQTSKSSDDSMQQTKADIHLITKLMCSFFGIAIASPSKQSTRGRGEEESFLQRLFDGLKSCAEVRFGPTSFKGLPRAYSRALKSLLKEAVEQNLQLDVSTIESILEQATGLFQDSDNQQIEWNLISLCLENNADVFIIPLGASSGTYSYLKANRYLISLLAVVDMTSDEADNNQLNSLKLNRILIPLLHAFARARDLAGFLEHWREQLNDRQKANRRVPSDGVAENMRQSLWEDDELLNAAQALIEPSLSVDQLDMILTKIESTLWKLNPNDDASFSVSELVILDCVFAGCHTENIRSKLSVRARSIYEALAEVPLKLSRAYRSHRWRLWRILATINRKWLSYDDGQSSIETTCKVAHRAFAVLDTTEGETKNNLVNTYREQSYAFSVVTTLALFNHLWTKTAESSIRNMLEKSVNRVLDFEDRLWFELNEDLIGTLRPLERPQYWNGRSIDIRSLGTLFLSCFEQLLAQSSIISCLDNGTQERMLRLLYQLACRERMCAMELSNGGIDYSWLWSRLQWCEVLNEDMRFLRALRQFQFERYMSVLGAEYPLHWKADSIEYTMAFESFQNAPVLQFEPEHRIDIANGLLDFLVRKKRLGLQTIAKHLQLLAKLADTPKKSGKFKKTSEEVPENSDEVIEKSMKVFKSIKMDDDPLQERSAIFVLAQMVSQEMWSVERLACDDALCRLTYVILEQVYATLSVDPGVEYFTQFYQWIGGEMERAGTRVTMFPSGWTSESSMLLVTMTALNYYHKNYKWAAETLGPHVRTIGNIRLQHFERVLGQLDTVWHISNLAGGSHILVTLLECLYEYSDLLASRPDKSGILCKLDRWISNVELYYNAKPPEPIHQWTTCGGPVIRAKYRKLTIRLGHSHQSPYDDLLDTLEAIENAPQGVVKSTLSHHFREMMRTPDFATLKHAFARVDLFKREHHLEALIILHAALYNLKNEDASKLQSEISNVFFPLCKTILASLDFRESMLSMQCIDLLLQKQPQIISQFHIDTLLSTVATTAYGFPSKQASTRTAKVYIGLCRLVIALLKFHRTKLGGRYHLILPVLQSLLRSLFIPYANSTATEQRSVFDKTHAGTYARLLINLSDPSPSAVARPGNRQMLTLNDETKREKSMMGQHLQYLVMTYCECQLWGKLAAEGMREALELGLWAVMNCLGQEVMRTLNAGMDSSGRAVWKRVYDDWKKFGHWQGE